MKLERLKILSESEIRQIHEVSVHILETCGVKIGNPAVRAFLKDRGLRTDSATEVVRFTRATIEDALATIPRSFEVFNREGKLAFMLGDGTPKVAAGHDTIFWVDSETGETRPSKVADVERFARVCEQLRPIDLIATPVNPQDVPHPSSSLLYGVKACLENSRKPLMFSTDMPEVNRACIDLVRAAFAGKPEEVYAFCALSPTSPLSWEKGVLEALVYSVKVGIPLTVTPAPIAGISGPYSLAGLLTLNNAECLSGLVMTQLVQPGAKVLYSSAWTISDMRRVVVLGGTPECTACRIASAQLAQYYKIPSHTTAPNSDNHAHDEQNAWEKTLSQFCSIAAGQDLIVNCGMFAKAMTSSAEQLVMDDEISGVSQRLARGIQVTEDTIARDLIEELGPGGSYLTTDHTVRWLRSDEYFKPGISLRVTRPTWESEGRKDTYEIAREQVQLLSARPVAKLDPTRAQKVEEVVSQFLELASTTR